MNGKKRQRSGEENSPMSKKKENKLKRHKSKREYKSAEHVDTDSETDESGSDADDVTGATHMDDPSPPLVSLISPSPSPSRSECRSASPSGSSVASNTVASGDENDFVDNPPTPKGNIAAILPCAAVMPLQVDREEGDVNAATSGSESASQVQPLGPTSGPNFPDDVPISLPDDLPIPLNAPPPIPGWEHRQGLIAKRREEHLKEGTNAPNYVQAIIFGR